MAEKMAGNAIGGEGVVLWLGKERRRTYAFRDGELALAALGQLDDAPARAGVQHALLGLGGRGAGVEEEDGLVGAAGAGGVLVEGVAGVCGGDLGGEGGGVGRGDGIEVEGFSRCVHFLRRG